MHTYSPQLDSRYVDCQKIRDKKISGAVPFIFRDGGFIEHRTAPERRDIQAEIQKLEGQLQRAKSNLEHNAALHKKYFADSKYSNAEAAAGNVRRFEKDVLFLTSRIESLQRDEVDILKSQIEAAREYIGEISRLMFSELETGIDADEKRLSEIAVRPAKKGA